MGENATGDRRGLSEFGWLAHFRAGLAGGVAAIAGAAAGEVHVGDDAAVLNPAVGKALFSTDVAVEGVHFDLELGSVFDAGWKVVVANVSDIAAMGGVPAHAVVGVAAPPGTDLGGLFDGVRAAADEYGVALVGGDLSSAPRLFLSVAILGDSGELAPVLRSGARPGDELWCTGPLGASAAGLAWLQARRQGAAATAAGAAGAATAAAEVLAQAYLHPIARPSEGRVAAELGATAMIDVSDGLSSDVSHIASESGVGIELDEVPVAPGATEQQALGGGEDYELVFAAPPGARVVEAFTEAGLRAPIRIGHCVVEPVTRALRGETLAITGWEHDLDG